MIDFDDVRALIAAHRDQTPCLGECHEALVQGGVSALGLQPGGDTVGQTLSVYRIRHQTSLAARLDTCGFEDTLASLALRPREERIVVCPFTGPGQVFIVLVSEATREILGCIRVNRRAGEPI